MRHVSTAVGTLVLTCAWAWAGCGGARQSLAGSGDDTGDSGAVFNAGDDDSGANGLLGSGGCATASTQAKREPVYLEFVLDGSGSMSSDNKWTAVVPALKSIFTEMQSAADDGVGAGLIVFSDTNDPTQGDGPYPTSADVPIAFVDGTHEGALSSRLGGTPNDGTPTHAALNGGYGVLSGFTPSAPLSADGKKVLVLITDGVPSDDCESTNLFGSANYASNPCIELAASELKAASPKGPIQTFVIGVGTFSSLSFFGLGGIDPSFLGNLAESGGTGAAGCNPNDTSSTTDLCYFEINPSQSTTASDLQMKFETALNAIRGQVVSCTFPLKSSNLTQVDPSLVNVEVGGKAILQDPKNGWTYDDPTAPTEILLHGSACSNVEGALSASVSIVVGCMTQIAK